MTQDYRPRPRELARELLNGYLVEHQLQSGDRLPSERSLCEAWGLSRSALRSATARMEKDGVLCSRPGAGTYVAQRKYTRNLQGLLSLSRSASEQGRRVTTRLLDLKRIECDKTLAKRFGQVLGYPLYKVARLRMVDGEPLMVETAFLPAERVEGLEKWDLERGSLFAVLEEAYGLIPEQGEEKVSITYATTDEAELMGIEEGAPLFWIVSQTYDQNGELLEYCRAAARPDRLRITSELIRGKIEGGEYPPGTAIPSVGTLAETYGIHRLSVRSAISALIGEGLLKSVQGKGIFVVGDKLERDLETVGGFRQNMQAKPESRVLVKALRPAGVVYGALLGCAPGEPVHYIKQVSYVSGEPVSQEETYIPEALLPNLKQVDLGVFSVYEALEFYGIRVARREQSLEITELDPMDARLLNVEPGRGVLVLSSVSYDEEGRAVEFTRSYTRGDKCTFSVRYQREG